MVRLLSIVILLILAAAGGFFVPRFLQYPSQSDYKFKFPDPNLSPPKAPAANVEYACTSITQAETYENRQDGPTANAAAGRYGDQASLKISGDGKGIVFAFLFDVTNGAVNNGEPIPITSLDGGYLIASKSNDAEVVSLVLDARTLRAVFSYTGQGMIGIRGKSILLACH